MRKLPDLSEAKYIALDIETFDPDLFAMGPGVRRDGYIVGISICTDTGIKQYMPFNHSAPGEQYEEKQIKEWCAKELCRESQPKIGTNILYDVDYLNHWGIAVKGLFIDISIAEPLIDETAFSFGLEALAKKYLGVPKLTNEIQEYCDKMKWKGKPQKHIWRMPPEVVTSYAEADAEQPLKIWAKQKEILKTNKQLKLARMEFDLMPMLLAMRVHGVKVSTSNVFKAKKEFTKDLNTLTKEIDEIAGSKVDLWAVASISPVLDKLNIKYPYTEKTNKPSVTAVWLEKQSHPFCIKLKEARQKHKFIGTFLDGQIIKSLVKDRIHCSFNQLKGDDKGTVSGRFSCTNPNLQFIPSRDPVRGPLCRSFFIPDPGCDWGRLDYSQIELRILAHYATGPGSDDIRAEFRNNQDADFHQMCADMAGIDRTKAKTINFGIVYGMGVTRTGAQLGLNPKESKEFLDAYHAKLPFIKTTTRKAEQAANRGYIKTIYNRRRHFNMWQPRDFKLYKEIDYNEDKSIVESHVKSFVDNAKTTGADYIPGMGVVRAMRHKALNAVIQGSAADLMKKAMVDIWQSGVCDILGPPHLTIHDELDFSVPRTNEGKEAFAKVKYLMENAIEFRVPVIAESIIGNNWGECK